MHKLTNYLSKFIQKEKELLWLCAKRSLENEDFHRLRILVHIEGSNINCTNSMGDTPLLLVCRYSKRNNLYICIEIILENPNVDINAKDRKGYNALMIASFHFCGSKMLQVVRLLLKHGIDVKSTSPDGSTALISLISNYHGHFIQFYQIVQALVNNGIEINLRMTRGMSAFLRLVSPGKSNANHYRRTDFCQVVEYLITKGVDLAVKDRFDMTPLHNICKHYEGPFMFKIVQLFVAAQVNINCCDRSGRKAVDYLIERGVSNYSESIGLLSL